MGREVDEEYSGYEILNIPAADPVQVAKWRYVEADWMICCTFGEWYEYNRNTGQYRELQPETIKAMRWEK